MKTTKTSELTDIALDYAVALAEGGTGLWHDTVSTWWINIRLEDRALRKGWAQAFTPSTDWLQAGPIIEREHIVVMYDPEAWFAGISHGVSPGGEPFSEGPLMLGPTLLVAAMRAYVASKLGDEVDIPVELMP